MLLRMERKGTDFHLVFSLSPILYKRSTLLARRIGVREEHSFPIIILFSVTYTTSRDDAVQILSTWITWLKVLDIILKGDDCYASSR